VSESEIKYSEKLGHTDAMLRAYKAPSRIWVNGNVMYVAGTSQVLDLIDDLALPTVGVAKTYRYAAVKREAERQATAGNPIKLIVGHSLGASVAHRIAAESNIRHIAVAEPAGWWSDPNPSAVRQEGDPISWGSKGTTKKAKGWNPHDMAPLDDFAVSQGLPDPLHQRKGSLVIPPASLKTKHPLGLKAKAKPAPKVRTTVSKSAPAKPPESLTTVTTVTQVVPTPVASPITPPPSERQVAAASSGTKRSKNPVAADEDLGDQRRRPKPIPRVPARKWRKKHSDPDYIPDSESADEGTARSSRTVRRRG
jgi:hypothetical protein